MKQHRPAIKSRSAAAIASRMLRLQPLRVRAVFACGFAAVALALFAVPAHALPRCTASISSCCRITRSGDYIVTQPLTTSSGNCLVIAAPNVKLELRGNNLTGGGISSGIGLHALSSAGHLTVVGPTYVSNFGIGVRNDAGAVSMNNVASDSNGVGLVDTGSNAIFTNVITSGNVRQGALFTHASLVRAVPFTANSNGGDGVVIDAVRNSTFEISSNFNAGNGLTIKGGSSGNSLLGAMNNNNADGVAILNSSDNILFEPNASDNSGNGITLKRGSGNSIVNANANNNHGDGLAILNSIRNTVQLGNAEGNAGVGIHIGCQPSSVPLSSGCRANTPSNDNLVDQFSTKGNTGWGIVIDKGNHRNRVINNDAESNRNGDLIDGNTDCDSNFWIENTFDSGSVSPVSCVQ
jgi:Right handed beta helix region